LYTAKKDLVVVASAQKSLPQNGLPSDNFAFSAGLLLTQSSSIYDYCYLVEGRFCDAMQPTTASCWLRCVCELYLGEKVLYDTLFLEDKYVI